MSRVFVISFDHTQAHSIVGRTPLDEGSVRRRDLYLTTHTLYKTNIHAPGGILTHDPYALDGAATGIGLDRRSNTKFNHLLPPFVYQTHTSGLWFLLSCCWNQNCLVFFLEKTAFTKQHFLNDNNWIIKMSTISTPNFLSRVSIITEFLKLNNEYSCKQWTLTDPPYSQSKGLVSSDAKPVSCALRIATSNDEFSKGSAYKYFWNLLYFCTSEIIHHSLSKLLEINTS
jgi:hypothetical protein